MKWRQEIQARFSGRPELTGRELTSEFGVDAEQIGELAECLVIFNEEYDIKPGWLRAGDSLDPFTRAPQATLLSWLWVRAAYEDSLSELNHHLNSERDRRGLPDEFPTPETVGDYVRLYFGIPLAGDGVPREGSG